MNLQKEKFFSRQFILFIMIGGINTLISYLTYLLLIPFFGYKVSYGLSYLTGIIVSYLLNGKITFKTRYSIKSVLLYPFVYVVHYFIGFSVLYVMVEKFAYTPKLAFVISVLIATPVTFVLNRYVFNLSSENRV